MVATVGFNTISSLTTSQNSYNGSETSPKESRYWKKEMHLYLHGKQIHSGAYAFLIFIIT